MGAGQILWVLGGLPEQLNNIRLEENGARWVAVTHGLVTDTENPASQFLLHVLGAERSLRGR